ncbi:MAG TPA: Holliday junction DNA helicase RuvB C-terminal domain-containing protein, partial [Aggregatilineales bacterium]|nr:Holliday junction DNA helicase RuvB C-terminal domain-containing protein [Aggregatilineales bacterium]
DRRLMLTIIEKFEGGPVGLNTLAAAISEDMATINDVYEPFLLRLGFLRRTHRGRMATRLAYEHLGVPYDDRRLVYEEEDDNGDGPDQPSLF